MAKKKVGFRIQEKIWDEFKRLAYAKHGDFYGAITYELEEALLNWVIQHTQKHTKQLTVGKVNPSPRVYSVFQEVKKYLNDKYYSGTLISGAGQQILRNRIVEAISAIRGTDPRTIQKWMKAFLNFKLIKWIAGEVYEIV